VGASESQCGHPSPYCLEINALWLLNRTLNADLGSHGARLHQINIGVDPMDPALISPGKYHPMYPLVGAEKIKEQGMSLQRLGRPWGWHSHSVKRIDYICNAAKIEGCFPRMDLFLEGVNKLFTFGAERTDSKI
jgi:hypothetical protein